MDRIAEARKTWADFCLAKRGYHLASLAGTESGADEADHESLMAELHLIALFEYLGVQDSPTYRSLAGNLAASAGSFEEFLAFVRR